MSVVPARRRGVYGVLVEHLTLGTGVAAAFCRRLFGPWNGAIALLPGTGTRSVHG